MSVDTLDAECLQLVRAFIKVRDPKARAAIIALVEAAGKGAEVTEVKRRERRGLSLVWSQPLTDSDY